MAPRKPIAERRWLGGLTSSSPLPRGSRPGSGHSGPRWCGGGGLQERK